MLTAIRKNTTSNGTSSLRTKLAKKSLSGRIEVNGPTWFWVMISIISGIIDALSTIRREWALTVKFKWPGTCCGGRVSKGWLFTLQSLWCLFLWYQLSLFASLSSTFAVIGGNGLVRVRNFYSVNEKDDYLSGLVEESSVKWAKIYSKKILFKLNKHYPPTEPLNLNLSIN